MVKFYRYILGVDLGISSIGTALILVDNDNNPLKILDTGVRTFKIPTGAADRRLARMMRKHIYRKRQRLARLKVFLQANGMLPLENDQLQQTIRKDPYALRAFGTKKPYLSLFDMGRSFLHMAKFRGAGFLDELEDADEDAVFAKDNDVELGGKKHKIQVERTQRAKQDKQKTASSYRKLETILNSTGQTLSEFFVDRLSKRQGVRRRAHLINQKAVDYAVPRFLVKDEFWKIWNTQAQEHKNLTQEIGDTIYKLIFQDRPHAPYATGRCSYFHQEKRLPKMHRLAEKRRIYEQVNNIRYDTTTAQYTLDKATRDILVRLAFEEGQDLNKTKIKDVIQKQTGAKVRQINLSDAASSIKSFVQINAFKDIPSWHNMSEAEQDAVVDFIADPQINPEDENSCLYPDDEFTAELCKRLNLNGADAHLVVGKLVHRLGKSRSNLGRTATIKIIEQLEKGQVKLNEAGEYYWLPLSHREAADLCQFEAEEEKHRAIQGKYDLLPYYGKVLSHDTAPIHPWHVSQATPEEQKFGRIPNPVVHVALNQLRKVVNEVINLYGKPQAIHLEMARELGMSAKKRAEVEREMLNRHKEHAGIDNELAKIHLPPTRKNRTKYRLWQEQGGKDVYSFKTIGLSDLATCEIDHIIPQSQGGTDTYMNLVLVHANPNFSKGNQFAYNFIHSVFPEQWSEISKLISSKKYPSAKAWRFSKEAEERFKKLGDEEQTDHRLTDTSYMAKIGKRYLWLVCSNTVCVKGGTTSRLRHLWGLDGLEFELLNLPIAESCYDAETGEIIMHPLTGYPKRNPLWTAKPRIDHRHHALDAIVAACTTRQMVSKIVRAEKNMLREPNFVVPFGNNAAEFREQVKAALQNTIVSPKPEHGQDGPLHAATKMRILGQNANGTYTIRYQRQLSNIKSRDAVGKIVFSVKTLPGEHPEVKKALKQCLYIQRTIESYYPLAEAQLQKYAEDQRLAGGKSIAINEQTIVAKSIALAQQDRKIKSTYPVVDNKSVVPINLELQYGCEPDNNYCIDFYEKEDGKVGWECVTLFDSMNKKFQREWQKAGYKHIWSLHNDDVIEINITEDIRKDLEAPFLHLGKNYFKIQKMSSGRVQFNYLMDARDKQGKTSLGSEKNIISAYTLWTSGGRGLSFFTKSAARRVDFTAFGKIQRKYKRLWHGKKSAASQPL